MMHAPITYHGNVGLLSLPQHGFLCSRATKSTTILPSLEWAQQMARGSEAVASTFHSPMERAVLDVLAMGTCPVVLVLGRSTYKHLPPELQGLMDSGRLAIVSVCKQGRISRESAQLCNSYIAQQCATLTFGFLSPQSHLHSIYTQAMQQNKPITVLASID